MLKPKLRKQNSNFLWRQGDVFIESVEEIPASAAVQVDVVLAEGEITGHQHRILDPMSARMWRYRDAMYFEVVADFAQLVHNEHATIWLERGMYHVWRQREYSPGQFDKNGNEFRFVLD